MRQKMIKTLLVALLIFSATASLYCQNNYASNVRTTVSDQEKLFIHYDIVVNDGSKFFKVDLKLTYEGETIEPNPNNLYGDFGRAMTPGNKIIYWNYGDEFGGDVNKIEVEVFAYKEVEPKALFKKSTISNNGFAPCEIIFITQSSNADKFEWDFGDASSGIENISYEDNPVHTFNEGGSYTIRLTAINTRLELEDTFLETIIIKEHGATQSDFQIAGYDHKAPVTIQFKNNSKNTDHFYWDFGDPGSGKKNNTSSSENPEHKFVSGGKYMVELTSSNSVSGLSDKMSKEVIIIHKNSGNSDYQKHKTLKFVLLAGGLVALGTSTVTWLNSNKYYDQYKTATTDAADLRNKSTTNRTISAIALGVSAVCFVNVYIQAKKQSEAERVVSFGITPVKNGGVVTLSYNF
jgi:PKD repeat protein